MKWLMPFEGETEAERVHLSCPKGSINGKVRTGIGASAFEGLQHTARWMT